MDEISRSQSDSVNLYNRKAKYMCKKEKQKGTAGERRLTRRNKGKRIGHYDQQTHSYTQAKQTAVKDVHSLDFGLQVSSGRILSSCGYRYILLVIWIGRGVSGKKSIIDNASHLWYPAGSLIRHRSSWAGYGAWDREGPWQCAWARVSPRSYPRKTPSS
jgi:hypothetical protein